MDSAYLTRRRCTVSAAHGAQSEAVEHFVAHGQPSEGEPGGNALGEDHDVRLHRLAAHVLVAPPLACSGYACLHLWRTPILSTG